MDTFDEKNHSCKISRYCTFNQAFCTADRQPTIFSKAGQPVTVQSRSACHTQYRAGQPVTDSIEQTNLSQYRAGQPVTHSIEPVSLSQYRAGQPDTHSIEPVSLSQYRADQPVTVQSWPSQRHILQSRSSQVYIYFIESDFVQIKTFFQSSKSIFPAGTSSFQQTLKPIQPEDRETTRQTHV